VVAAGNLLSASAVPRVMVAAFSPRRSNRSPRACSPECGRRSRQGRGGPVHSAGLLVVRDVAWPVADLRVDWHETDPIAALADLWVLWAPQMDAYVTRALDPSRAPSYGVPGDPGGEPAARRRGGRGGPAASFGSRP